MSRWREEKGAEPLSDGGDVQLTAWVHGYVQGVGFRWWTASRALELGLDRICVEPARRPGAGGGAGSGGMRASDCSIFLQSGRTPGSVDNVVADWSEPSAPIAGFSER